MHSDYTGGNKPKAKLTNVQAAMIRNLYRLGQHTQQQIADMFKTCQPVISQIVNRKTYRK